MTRKRIINWRGDRYEIKREFNPYEREYNPQILFGARLIDYQGNNLFSYDRMLKKALIKEREVIDKYLRDCFLTVTKNREI